jgi:hypothetical protein
VVFGPCQGEPPQAEACATEHCEKSWSGVHYPLSCSKNGTPTNSKEAKIKMKLRQFITIFAILAISAAVTARADVIAAMDGHILGKGVLVGRFHK